MSNPTSNFNWQMPTSSDLVTDLPADFEVFGQAVDTSLADLKGGTTGQILSKNSNTDMDFVWTSANPGDITAVTAGTGISGGGTSGAVTITNDMATTITSNGDLIYGTGSGTYARRAIGTTGQVLTVSGGVPTWATAGAGFVGCRASGQNGTFPHDTLTTITYSTDTYDTDGFHDTSTNTNRFTVPSGKAGKYLCINNGMRFTNWNMSDAYLTVRVNGTEQFRQYPGNFPSNGRPSIMNINQFDLAVGDYVDYAFYQASGSSQDIIAGGFVIFTYLGA